MELMLKETSLRMECSLPPSQAKQGLGMLEKGTQMPG